MKNKTFIIFLLVISAYLSLAMSGFKKDNDIPVPANDYKTLLVDRAGIQTSGHHISIDGDTFFRAKMGKVTLFVEFKDLQKVTFTNHEEKHISAAFLLRDGKKFEGIVNGSVTLFGHADFGKFKVRMREIVSLEFIPENQ